MKYHNNNSPLKGWHQLQSFSLLPGGSEELFPWPRGRVRTCFNTAAPDSAEHLAMHVRCTDAQSVTGAAHPLKAKPIIKNFSEQGPLCFSQPRAPDPWCPTHPWCYSVLTSSLPRGKAIRRGEAAAGLCSESFKRHIEKTGFGKRCREWCICVRSRTVAGRE